MSVILFNNKTIENKPIYKADRRIQVRNPIYNQRISGVYCEYCQYNRGRKRLYHTLNKLTAHTRQHHRYENYQEKIMLIADKIISGELQ